MAWGVASSRCSGGNGRLVGDLAADHAKAAYEREAVGVVAGLVGGLADQRPDGVVGQQQTPRLLFDQLGCFRAEDLGPPAQVGLDLVDGGLDGLITNGKFCCTRRVRLRLTWWRRPLRLQRSALQTDPARAGEPHDPDLDCPPTGQSPPRWRAPLGPGLPAAGALGGRATPRDSPGGADYAGGA